MNTKNNERVYNMEFAKLYPMYVQKAFKKQKTEDEVKSIIFWLTGYDHDSFSHALEKQVSVRTFFDEAPRLNPNAVMITGVICGVRIEDIEDPLMKKLRYLDKMIDELAKGKSLDKILRD